MSSAANHRKRSHRSETRKSGAYNTSARRALYREAREQRNRNIFGRIWSHVRNNRRQSAATNRVKEATP